MIIWSNGELVEHAEVSVLTHALNYGTGAFEGIRAYKQANGRVGIFRLNDHIQRLHYSSKYLELNPPSIKTLERACKEVIKQNNFKDAYIRPLIIASTTSVGLRNIHKTSTYMYAVPFDAYINKDALKVMIPPYRRIPPFVSNPKAKITGHYIISTKATLHALENNYDEALMLDHLGRIAEGAGENIAFIKQNKVVFPESDSILPGITRKTLMEFLHDLGFEVEERHVYPYELKEFDEAFFMGTAVEVKPIKQINDIKYKTSKSKKIRKYYLDIVRGKVEKYKHYITLVD